MLTYLTPDERKKLVDAGLMTYPPPETPAQRQARIHRIYQRREKFPKTGDATLSLVASAAHGK